MDLNSEIDLQDCPRCHGPGILEEEAGWCVYVACLDCGSRTAELSALVQDITQRSGTPGIRSQTDKRELASAWLELALACAKVTVKYEADQWKQEQKLQQENTGPVLQM